MSPNSHLLLYSVPNIPFVRIGDDLPKLIPEWLEDAGFEVMAHDILVVAQKIVSRAEGRVVNLSSIQPSSNALTLGAKTGRDPRLCQLILENGRVLYTHNRAIMTEDRLGIINTSSGVDRSNSGSSAGDLAVLLPIAPDLSAKAISDEIKRRYEKDVAVLISDSLGRPWRRGSTGMAIGVFGMEPVLKIKAHDLSGRQINPEIAVADEVAAAASLLMGEANEGRPVVLVRGVQFPFTAGCSLKDLLRPLDEDQVW